MSPRGAVERRTLRELAPAAAALLAFLAAVRLVPGSDVVAGIALATALALHARIVGLTATDLGLAPSTWRRGLLWGAAAAAIVASAYGIAGLVPAARDLVAGSATSVSGAVLAAAVTIPVATVVPEEIAFRGVIPALVGRRHGRLAVTLVSSLAFGVWHLLPATGGGAANAAASDVLGSGPGGLALRIVGTVALTALAGVVLLELRRRSGSLLAPVLVHWAINGVGALFVALAAR